MTPLRKAAVESWWSQVCWVRISQARQWRSSATPSPIALSKEAEILLVLHRKPLCSKAVLPCVHSLPFQMSGVRCKPLLEKLCLWTELLPADTKKPSPLSCIFPIKSQPRHTTNGNWLQVKDFDYSWATKQQQNEGKLYQLLVLKRPFAMWQTCPRSVGRAGWYVGVSVSLTGSTDVCVWEWERSLPFYMKI